MAESKDMQSRRLPILVILLVNSAPLVPRCSFPSSPCCDCNYWTPLRSSSCIIIAITTYNKYIFKLVSLAACCQVTPSFLMHQWSVIEAKRNAGFSITSLSVLKMLVGVSVVRVLINIDGSAHRMWEGGGRLLRHHNQRNMCDSCYLPVVDAPMIPFDDLLYKIRAHGVVFEWVCYVTSVYAFISVRDESFLSAFVVNAYPHHYVCLLSQL